MHLSPNTNLQSGKYRIIRVLGQGGFGITYLAVDLTLDREVAIKEFFPKDFCGRDNTSHLTLGTQNNAETVTKLKDRFLKEAKNIAKLDHPGIIKIHDVFEENNTAYYVMDYIEGENLNEMVKRNGPLSETKAVEYIRKVGDALDYIHSRKMTHFDVKPANIVVRRSDDRPILIDFGLSKDFGNGMITTMLQAISNGFSPTELYNVSSIQSWSPETDLYSLAATLYFLITAKVPPFAGDLREDSSLLIIPSNISEPTRRAITNVMTVPRSQRPKSVQTFTDALHNDYNGFRGGQPGTEQVSNDYTHIVDDDINFGNHPNIDDGKDANGNTETPKNKSSKLLLWVVGIIIIGIIVFVISGYFIDYSLGSHNDKEIKSNTEEIAQNESKVEPVSNAGAAPYTGKNAEVYNDSHSSAFDYLRHGYSHSQNGYDCFYLKGYFTDDGVNYPVMLCIIEDGNSYRAVYKNMTYGGKIYMSIFQNGSNSLELRGKDANNSFVIDMSYENGVWRGYADDGPKTMPAFLESTSDTFSF